MYSRDAHHRVPYCLVKLVAKEMNTEEIIESYPYLESEDIRQALQYAAWLAEEGVHSPGPVSI